MQKALSEEQKEGLVICVDKAIRVQREIALKLQRDWDALCGQGRVPRGDAMDGEVPCGALSLRITTTGKEIAALESRDRELKAGRFKGLCRDCGNPIGFDRLCSRPAAETCTSCGEAHKSVPVKGRHGTIMVPQSAHTR